MIGEVLDVFRMRQYFDVLVRARDVARDLLDDAGLVNDVRRAVVPLPGDRWPDPDRELFPQLLHLPPGELEGRRVGIVATGGSGALASVVGVGRAFEEYGIAPAVISVCSGSALFGFPLAAGVPPEELACFTASLRPSDYVDPNWPELVRILPTLGRGFAGIIRGELLEETYRGLLGDMTLGEMPVPAYAPIWNIEHNRVEYLGPATRPDLPVARAVHMAVALPLFLDPVVLDGDHWCDGGIVDIFPVHPLLDLEPRCDLVVAVNGFYPPGFVGEDQTGWQDRRFSILDIASQVRTAQQIQLARENLDRLTAATDVCMIEPVPYGKVQGAGFYRQFLDTREWGEFILAGLEHAHEVLAPRASPGDATYETGSRDRARMRLNA